MTQIFFFVLKKSNILPLFLSLVMFLLSSLANAGGDKDMEGQKYVGPIAIPNPAADLWRAIRQGESGFVSNPDQNASRLIFGIPRDDCKKAGNCSEQAVGFSLPIHQYMPAITEKRGVGGSAANLGFVLSLFACLMLAGFVFIYKLIKSRPGEDATREDSAK